MTQESTTEALQGERNSTLASLQGKTKWKMSVRNQNSGSIRAALMEMSFIGDCIRHHEAAKAVATEWQYVAMVLDRLLLWVRFYFKKVAKISSDFSAGDFLWNNFYISQPFDLSRHRRL